MAISAGLCSSCGHPLADVDVYCPSCGARTVPDPVVGSTEPAAVRRDDSSGRTSAQKSSSRAIFYLAIMFAVFGALLFFRRTSDNQKILKKLEGRADDQILVIEGKSYPISALRKEIAREPAKLLVLNLVLSAVMFGLHLWSKKAPLPAVIVAFSIFAVINIANAMVDPKTIAQGLVMKVLMIALLVRGIRDALVVRKSESALPG